MNDSSSSSVTTERSVATGPAIRYGWESVKKSFWYFVGLAAIVAVISSIGSNDRDPNSWDILGLFLSTWMTCGATALLLSYQRGQKLPLTKVFTEIRQYWQVLGATLLVGLMVTVGTLFFIVPGIYLAITYQFTVPLIIERKLGVIEAMRASAAMTKGQKWNLFGFDLTCLGVILLGALALGVGLLVAMPVVWLAYIRVYRDLVVP